MSLQILRRQPTQTLSQRPLCLKALLLRIREREHRRKERRAYWRRFFGLDRRTPQVEAPVDDLEASAALSEAIIKAGLVLFCASLACVVAIGVALYLKTSSPRRQYVVQSGFVEVVPK